MSIPQPFCTLIQCFSLHWSCHYKLSIMSKLISITCFLACLYLHLASCKKRVNTKKDLTLTQPVHLSCHIEKDHVSKCRCSGKASGTPQSDSMRTRTHRHMCYYRPFSDGWLQKCGFQFRGQLLYVNKWIKKYTIHFRFYIQIDTLKEYTLFY